MKWNYARDLSYKTLCRFCIVSLFSGRCWQLGLVRGSRWTQQLTYITHPHTPLCPCATRNHWSASGFIPQSNRTWRQWTWDYTVVTVTWAHSLWASFSVTEVSMNLTAMSHCSLSCTERSSNVLTWITRWVSQTSHKTSHWEYTRITSIHRQQPKQTLRSTSFPFYISYCSLNFT